MWLACLFSMLCRLALQFGLHVWTMLEVLTATSRSSDSHKRCCSCLLPRGRSWRLRCAVRLFWVLYTLLPLCPPCNLMVGLKDGMQLTLCRPSDQVGAVQRRLVPPPSDLSQQVVLVQEDDGNARPK
mmetsp:Transcript_81864/g.265198  ORF Transcript_81864/g.265198 Transcript_81864/m.265198 type:complete len:127 (-) Transcript_81864:273-653(-)